MFTNFTEEYMVHKINEFYLTNNESVYPNAVLLTKKQLYSFYPEVEESDLVIESLHGLKVILTDYIEEPRLLKI
jgi:hypothetical protein